MRKGPPCGLAAALLLTILGLSGCSAPSGDHQPGKRQAKEPEWVEPKITVTRETGSDRDDKVVAKSDDLNGMDRAPQAGLDTSCRVDTDCVVVPIDGCLPCFEGAKQEPANKASAHKTFDSLKEKCLPIVQKQMESSEQPRRTPHASCEYNGAKCMEGSCKLAKLTEEEVKAMMPQGAPPRGQGHEMKAPAGLPALPAGHGDVGRGGPQPNFGMGSQGGNSLPPMGYNEHRGYADFEGDLQPGFGPAGGQGHGPQGQWQGRPGFGGR